jgi:hypothetical protein
VSVNLGVGGRIIVEWILNWFGGLDWINQVHVRDKWRAVVNTVMNVGVP